MAEPNNTPVPGSTPRSGSPSIQALAALQNSVSPFAPTKLSAGPRPRILHLGDPFRYGADTYAILCAQCDVVRPSEQERQRDEFIRALQEKRWGDFHAVVWPPGSATGGEMGAWDFQLIGLLPPSVKLFASGGSADGVDASVMEQRKIVYYGGGEGSASDVLKAHEEELCLRIIIDVLSLTHPPDPPINTDHIRAKQAA